MLDWILHDLLEFLLDLLETTNIAPRNPGKLADCVAKG
jgi:hypothetical protein